MQKWQDVDYEFRFVKDCSFLLDNSSDVFFLGSKIMASGPTTSRQIDRETVETVANFFWAPKSLQVVITAMKLKDAYSLEGKLWPTQTAY